MALGAPDFCFRRFSVSALGFVVLSFALSVFGLAAESRTGWNFDTGLSLEDARELLVTQAPDRPPKGSWVRLRGLDTGGPFGGGKSMAAAARINHVNESRRHLVALRNAGFQLVVFVRWSPESWPGGVRQDRGGHRLAQDLRDAFARCRELAETYGDLVDFWEIDNEPDISFVQENPETYAAFLKACYLGVRRGAATLDSAGLQISTSNSQLTTAPRDKSRMLMAPLGLPPGPYFEAFAHNDGLRYTDGFNYHYYGYAEDFSGMYRQCELAVAETDRENAQFWPQGASEGTAVLRTQFYPSADGWHGEVTASFDQAGAAARAQAAPVLAPPRAVEEPPLHASGRWLVTDGMTVEEFPGGWRFRVARWPHRAELPLPPEWAPGKDSLLSFHYRLVEQGGPCPAAEPTPKPSQPIGNISVGRPLAKADRAVGRQLAGATPGVGSPLAGAQAPEARASSLPTTNTDVGRQLAGAPAPVSRAGSDGERTASATAIIYPGADHRSSQKTVTSRWPSRELPVFLTEYGYGSLDKRSRLTPEGREGQRLFFQSVAEQIRELGIEGAMAFLLRPYLELDQLEFGLLMSDESGPPEARASLQPTTNPVVDRQLAGAKWGPYTVSPALEKLLAVANDEFPAKRWRVTTPPPSAVVIDFIARKGLGMAKSYSGYFLEGEHGRSIPGEADLALYNFGSESVSGVLELDGDAWVLTSGAQALRLTLASGERRFVAVHVRPAARRFVACPVSAWFKPGSAPPADAASTTAVGKDAAVVTALSAPVPVLHVAQAPLVPLKVAPMPPPGEPLHMFEPYFRTQNGNVYTTWPRLVPVEAWQVYMQRTENFTPGFYGRLYSPYRFAENKPISLVFMFHPAAFPVVIEVRYPQMLKFSAPKPVP